MEPVTQEEATRALVCAIIEQAVEDYRGLKAAGWVDGRRIQICHEVLHKKRCKGDYAHVNKIEELLDFLTGKTEGLSFLLDLSGANICADWLRKELKL